VPSTPQEQEPSPLTEAAEAEGIPSVRIGDARIPLSAPPGYENVCAILNFVLAAMGLLLVMLLIVVRNLKDKRRAPWFWCGVAMMAASVIIVAVTQRLYDPLVLVDAWTFVHALLFVIEAIALFCAYRTVKEPDGATEAEVAL
jgi:uncharacterized membrane protein YhaH (DUF805 family)